MALSYVVGNDLDLDEVIGLYVASTLGERRPIDEPGRMEAMIRHANLVVTAWEESPEGRTLVGISRSMSDFRYVTYLADLAVRATYQRRGVGVELIRRTRAEAPEAMIVLLAAPKAVEYYPRVGFTKHQSAWVLRPGEELITRGESC